MVIHIQDDIVKLHGLGLLDELLADRTTKKHLIWATNAYRSLGAGYGWSKEIKAELLTGVHSGVIETRARKAAEQRSERTRRHAEVFTPLWVCRKMNDHLDEVWSETEGSSEENWKKYVDSKRLEITCGEAPYLVSRYDMENGELVPVPERVGMLDRKLRMIGEHARTEEEWLDWTERAFRSVYGYEFQGDNVLIARINLLMTFEEYILERWKRLPTVAEYKNLLHIITWNIWQMDGLTGSIPREMGTGMPGGAGKRCRIFNWSRNRSERFPVPGNVEKRAAKFQFVIGNPPYQDETIGENRGFAPPVYHKFLECAYQLADLAELIHPARFLFNAGSTPRQWNRKMLADPHISVLYYEQDASKVFSNTEIKGGVAITYRDTGKEFGPIGTFTPYLELNSILRKVHQSQDFSSFSAIVITRTAYKLTKKLHEEHPEAIDQLSSGHAFDMSTNIFSRLPQVFYETRPEDGHDYIRILGREGGRRVYKFIRSDYVNQVSNLHKYKIYVPKANGAGVLGERLSAPVLAGPGVGATETFLSIGAFGTEREAEAALKYIQTKFARILLGVLKTTQDITPQKWAYVPLQDFTRNSDIDWTEPVAEIDRKCYAKYHLSEAEIEFIEAHGEEME